MNNPPVYKDSFEKSGELRDYHYDIKHSFSNYFSLLASNVGVGILSFTNTFLLTRWLGAEGYGRLSLFLSISSGILVLGVNWTVESLARFGCEELVQTGKINAAFWARAFLLMLNLIPIALGCYILRHFINGYIKVDKWASWLILAYSVGMAFFFHMQYALQAAKRIAQVGLLQLIGKALLTIGLCIAVATAWMNVTGAIYVFVLAAYALTLAFFLLINPRKLVPVRLDKMVVKKLLLFSWPLLFGSLSGFFSSGYLDVIVIKHFLPLTEVGVYYLASQLSGMILQVPTVACTVLSPMLTTFHVKDRKDLIDRYLTRVLPNLVFLWSVVVCVIMFCSQYILPVAFGLGFRSAVAPFGVLLIANSLASVIFLGYGPMYSVYKMTLLGSLIGILSAMVNLAGNLVLIPLFGLIGCAVATLANYITTVGLGLLVINRRLMIRNRKIFFAITPVITAFLFWIYFKQSFWGFVVLLIQCYYLIRRLRLFSRTDLAMLDDINMPSPLKRLIIKICRGG